MGEAKKEKIKPVVILTNFWDANKLIEQGFALFNEDEKVYKVNLFPDRSNFVVHSIALSHPSLSKLEHLENSMWRLDHFCPTYNLLHRYKDDKDWEAYVRDYKDILKNRKDRIRSWVDGLAENRAYILCCWENTALNSKCHRQILYEAFKSSSYTKDKMVLCYRNGDEFKKGYSVPEEYRIEMGEMGGVPDDDPEEDVDFDVGDNRVGRLTMVEVNLEDIAREFEETIMGRPRSGIGGRSRPRSRNGSLDDLLAGLEDD